MQAKITDNLGTLQQYRKRGYQSRSELVDLAYAKIGKKAQGTRFRKLVDMADVLVGTVAMFSPKRVEEISEFIDDQQGFSNQMARKFITGKFQARRR